MTFISGTGSTAADGPPDSGTRQANPIGACRASHAHRQDRVGTQAGLAGAAIELVHGRINGHLIEGAQPAEGRCEPLFHIADGLADPLAEVTHGIAIAQLMGFVGTGAGAAGHDCPAAGTSSSNTRLRRLGAAESKLPVPPVSITRSRESNTAVSFWVIMQMGPHNGLPNAPCVCCTPCFGWAIWSAPRLLPEVFKMSLLRRKDYLRRFTPAFVGYGPESDQTVLELTHNWDTSSYELARLRLHRLRGG